MLSKSKSDQPAKLFMYNEAENYHFDFFSKCALGMIFHLIVLDLYAYDLHKNAEKARVISFLSQILCQKAVPGTFPASYSNLP